EWPGQEVSDGVDLGRLAVRHPRASFILAHIGGGGDWAHSCAAVREIPNIYIDLSGSGVDRGMLDLVYASVGAARMLWGCDITMETGLAKLRALDAIGMGEDEIEEVRWRNAARIFPHNALPGIPTSGVAARRTDAHVKVKT
ncbi:MAG: amidohydrolase family protein, partial [Gemmatimonadaceae bacterium]